jgi:hypothetical protein
VTHQTEAVAFRNARVQYTPRVGFALPGGGTVLACRNTGRHDMRETYVVLCVLPGARQSPFVTWEFCVGTQVMATSGYGPLAYAYWGHYYHDLEDAFHDYKVR